MAKYFKSNNGLALPLVLMVMFIVILFSIVILGMGSTSTIMAANQNNGTQAYYLARSGVDAVASYIVENLDGLTPAALDNKINSIIASGKSAPFKLASSDKGTIQVAVQKDNNILNIIAEGNVNNITKKVTKTIYISNGTSQLAFDKAIFAKGKLDFTGSSIKGNIASLDTVNLNWGTLQGDIFIAPGASPNNVLTFKNSAWPDSKPKPPTYNMDSIPTYPDIPFPDFPAYITTLTQQTSQLVVGQWPVTDYTINNNAYYTAGINVANNTLYINRDSSDRIIRTKSLTIGGSGKIIDNRTGEGKLIIQVDGDFTINSDTYLSLNIGNQDVEIRAKRFISNQGHIVVSRPTNGKGKLLIYADEALQISGGSRINTTSVSDQNAMGDQNLAFVYYAGTQAVTLGGSTKIAATLHVKQADLTLGNSNGIVGNIVTGGQNLVISGDASASVKVIYAPNAFVNMSSGSGKVKGSIIAGSISMAGGASVEYIEPNSGLDYFNVSNNTTSYNYGIWK